MEIDRKEKRDAAFGLGIYRCIGSNLARMVIRVALQEWPKRIPDFRLDPPGEGNLVRGDVRGPRQLKVLSLRAFRRPVARGPERPIRKPDTLMSATANEASGWRRCSSWPLSLACSSLRRLRCGPITARPSSSRLLQPALRRVFERHSRS